jgi:hypothetical protein
MILLDLELDEVESHQLERFCSVNNVSAEQAAALLIKQRLDEWADSIVNDIQSDVDVRH